MKISVVSYLNSAPLVHGILHSGYLDDCTVSIEIPAIGAKKLTSGEADLALVPVGAFSDPGCVEWVGNYCIGVEGPVRSVCLFSEVPVEQIRKVWLDPHSRTTVRLIRILAAYHWKVHWDYLPASEGFELSDIKGEKAGICIGDKVFAIENRYPYRYDMAEEWIRMTGLPFVFAAWAIKKPVPPGLIERLDRAQEYGIKTILRNTRDWSKKWNLPESLIRDYLTRNISYPFTDRKKEGMSLFHGYLNKKEG
ncbi:MAG: menaquinone biosynthesis protein [Bacteroidota bacterium]